MKRSLMNYYARKYPDPPDVAKRLRMISSFNEREREIYWEHYYRTPRVELTMDQVQQEAKKPYTPPPPRRYVVMTDRVRQAMRFNSIADLAEVVAIPCGEKIQDKFAAGFVYGIKDEKTHALKIGWSKDPSVRMNDLQTSTANKLRLVTQIGGRMQLEFALHHVFRERRIKGEWFDDSDGYVSAGLFELAAIERRKREELAHAIPTEG